MKQQQKKLKEEFVEAVTNGSSMPIWREICEHLLVTYQMQMASLRIVSYSFHSLKTLFKHFNEFVNAVMADGQIFT